MSASEVFRKTLAVSAKNIEALSSLTSAVTEAADVLISAISSGNTIYFCGNGGSAADAQHLAAELSGRFLKDRQPLPGIALTTNTSALTAIGNDYGFEEVFSRQLEGVGKPGDILIALSTSGNSKNILKAADSARAAGVSVIGMTGSGGGELATKCNVLLNVPSDATPRIQEMHILVGHVLCEAVENAVLGAP